MTRCSIGWIIGAVIGGGIAFWLGQRDADKERERTLNLK